MDNVLSFRQRFDLCIGMNVVVVELNISTCTSHRSDVVQY